MGYRNIRNRDLATLATSVAFLVPAGMCFKGAENVRPSLAIGAEERCAEAGAKVWKSVRTFSLRFFSSSFSQSKPCGGGTFEGIYFFLFFI